MKFLAIGRPMSTASTLPLAVNKQLLEISAAAINQLKKEGKYLEGYYSPAGCIFVILEYNSAEEWVKDQNLQPLLRYYNQEIYPLADMDESMKGFLEAIKMAEQMMPK